MTGTHDFVTMRGDSKGPVQEIDTAELLAQVVDDLYTGGTLSLEVLDNISVAKIDLSDGDHHIFYTGPLMRAKLVKLSLILELIESLRDDDGEGNQSRVGLLLHDPTAVPFLLRDSRTKPAEGYTDARGALMVVDTEFAQMLDDATESYLRQLEWGAFVRIVARWLNHDHTGALELMTQR